LAPHIDIQLEIVTLFVIKTVVLDFDAYEVTYTDHDILLLQLQLAIENNLAN
jgi:hypothetical protein